MRKPNYGKPPVSSLAKSMSRIVKAAPLKLRSATPAPQRPKPRVSKPQTSRPPK